VVTTGAINYHQQTNTQFFTGRIPFLSPNQECDSAEENYASCERNIALYKFTLLTYLLSVSFRPVVGNTVIVSGDRRECPGQGSHSFTDKKIQDFSKTFQDQSDFRGLSRSWNFQEKIQDFPGGVGTLAGTSSTASLKSG